jgi:hypothetical protein
MKFTILFHDGNRIEDEAHDRAGIAQILDLQRAREAGHDFLGVGVVGGRRYTVGDIKSVEIEAVES